ncbi:MAG: tetratricopeptide repeat protein, partial [Methanoregula sp.]
KALEAYDTVLALDPAYALAWVGKGQVYDFLKQYDKAISCYEEACRIDPKDSGFRQFIDAARAEKNKIRNLPKRSRKR